MFFGREDELRDLLDSHGSCFVYGGRQLGKSALLRTLRTRAHDPQDGRVCTFIDLKGEGIGGRLPADAAWAAIARQFGEDGLPVAEDAGDREGVVGTIRTWLDDDPHRQVRLLLDETDAFLEQDAPRLRQPDGAAQPDGGDGPAVQGRSRRASLGEALQQHPEPAVGAVRSDSPIGPLDWTRRARSRGNSDDAWLDSGSSRRCWWTGILVRGSAPSEPRPVRMPGIARALRRSRTWRRPPSAGADSDHLGRSRRGVRALRSSSVSASRSASSGR